ncbi:hypothetical protein [Pyxidicoccus trucidator]|uniref:hypothetical protein n=1 Tax=Pyxidicoccus trucidator TaxID=2709662 RepID=UPI0013DAE279|nr:hypothetical protein [Pyxidicoccus trucidator]
MASITVTIFSNDDIRYSPSSVVRHGDTVTFALHDIPGEVDVAFDAGSCLTPPGPYTLNGHSLLTSSSQQTVTLTADAHRYAFTVTIPGGTEESRKRGEHETKKGGLDVTTDPPEDPKDAK